MTPTDDIFKPYLMPILEAQKVANGVTYVEMSEGNGMDRMLEDSRSENVYPGIFVLRPKWRTRRIENHILMVEFSTVFYVWCHGELDEREAQEQAYNKAETIVTAIIEKLQHDSRTYQNFLDFDSIQAEPVVYLGVDATYGYEVKLKLGLEANELFC